MPALPLAPLVGSLWVPAWAVRPGAYEVLRPVIHAMPTWLVIHSRSTDYSMPCYASREQIGKTVGASVRTVTRDLALLRDVGLLFEVARGADRKTRRRRPPARWALCPFASHVWASRVGELVQRIAEEDGQSTYWTHRALADLEDFGGESGALRVALSGDMPFVPRPPRKKSRNRKRANA